MAPTAARQRNAISEGMALGLLACGCDSLPYNKIKIDLAFEGAWRTWTYRNKFPQVNTDLANGLDAIWAMTRVDSQKNVWVLYWEQDGNQFQIHSRDPDWTPDNPDDLTFATEMIPGDVPLAGWEELARAFLKRFEQRQD